MHLVVVSIGRLKQGPERELAERYAERFGAIGRKLGFRGLDIHEIAESRARDPATRIAEEAAAISTAIPEKSVLVALDERGDNVDSATFARHLGRWRDEQVGHTIFMIGGADGLSPDLRRKAKLRMAFGSATWPHQMVRVMLLEQIYRAATILVGHPYHRA
jgi:23S rRNA (pseudouridine1915-N3)-methyltransferase